MVALSYRGDVAANEHQQLLDAALRRDAETAKRVLVLHIQGGVEHALARGTLK
jgi:DNA-binding GntR family transcriptional regulator